MLSGIGPAADLGIFGIPVRQELPVGENLRTTGIGERQLPYRPQGLFGIFTPENWRALHSAGRGPLPQLPGGERLLQDALGPPAPDVEFHFAAAPFFDEGSALRPTTATRSGP